MSLPTLTDEQLINRIRSENCSDSIIELSNRHRALVTAISKKYANAAQCSGISLGDFIENTESIVYDAAKKFDAEKEVKFSTWLGENVRFHCLHALKRESKYFNPNQDQFTEKLANSVLNEDAHEKDLVGQQMEYVMNILAQVKDKRIETIIRMRYLNGKSKKTSFSVIAKHLKISTQGVINLHDSFMAFLKGKMRANENMDRI